MAFVDDDEQVFQAALSLVDEFALDELNPENLELPTLSTAAVVVGSDAFKQRRREQANARRRQKRKEGEYADPNRARNKRRQELAHLRGQLEELQLDVQALRSSGARPRHGAEQKRFVFAPTPQLPAVWQELATRQRRRREETERENLQLKRAVERQRQVAEGLKDLMRKRASLLMKECSIKPSLTHHVVAVLDGDVQEDFRVLLRHLETAYKGVDALFVANGLASLNIAPGDVHLREGMEGRFLECFSYKLLPFSAPATAEATWKHFQGIDKHLGNGSLYQKAAKNLDEPYTIIEDFTKELYSNSSRADIKVKQVVRRYVEEDRDVIIWVARVTPAQIKNKLLRGLTYHLRGYAVTKQHGDSTLLQQCSLVSLDQDASTKLKLADLHVISNFMAVNTAENIRAHRERIEDKLIDRAVAS
jgi:hypothetical protein